MEEAAPVTVSIRVPPRWLERLDALVPYMIDDPEVSFRVTRSAATRHALADGMKYLEVKYGIAKQRAASRKAKGSKR